MLNLKKYGRGIVLPIKKIDKITDIFCKKITDNNPILDFGAGTLFYSERFYQKYKKEIFALDPLYEKKAPKLTNNNIHLCKNLSDIENVKKFSMIFSCDVLHHVHKGDMEKILEEFSKKTNLVIIKDIEATDFLGNLQNKIHDLLLSRQLVNNIYSKKIRDFYKKRGFHTKTYYMKKLGYPHFLLIAYKKSDE